MSLRVHPLDLIPHRFNRRRCDVAINGLAERLEKTSVSFQHLVQTLSSGAFFGLFSDLVPCGLVILDSMTPPKASETVPDVAQGERDVFVNVLEVILNQLQARPIVQFDQPVDISQHATQCR